MKEETRVLLDELLLKPAVAYCATVDENGEPFIRTIFNLRCTEKYPHQAKAIREYESDPHTIYVATNTSSTKVKHLRKNTNASVYYSIPEEFKGIMLQGQAEFLEDMELKKKMWVDEWKIYYPEGVTDPDFTIFRIKPKILRGWYKGHHSYEFEG